jgi:Tol biopolymer transport system component
MDDRIVSHYHWKDEKFLLVWGRLNNKGDQYYLVNVENSKIITMKNEVLNKYGDGHCSFSPDKRWVITDTYPDRSRNQRLLLFDTINNKCTVLGKFFSPWKFIGINRCDLHPRWSPDGKLISIDSAHSGCRKTYFLDLKNFITNA